MRSITCWAPGCANTPQSGSEYCVLHGEVIAPSDTTPGGIDDAHGHLVAEAVERAMRAEAAAWQSLVERWHLRAARWKAAAKMHRNVRAINRARAERAEQERDRETELRREAEAHNAELKSYLDRIGYPSDWEELLEEVARVTAERDRLRAALEILGEDECNHTHDERFPCGTCHTCIARAALEG